MMARRLISNSTIKNKPEYGKIKDFKPKAVTITYDETMVVSHSSVREVILCFHDNCSF